MALMILSVSTLFAQSNPVITSSPTTVIQLGEVYLYDVEATGTPLPAFVLEDAPQNMVIDAESGVISWTPTGRGDFAVKVSAQNFSGTDSQEYTLSVTNGSSAPSITSMPVVQAFAGQEYYYDVNASGDPPPTYVLAQAPEGMQIDDMTGEITWTPQNTGQYNVSIIASNADGSDIQEFGLTVSDGGFAPVITSVPPTEVSVGQEYVYQIIATGDPDPDYYLDAAPEGMTINQKQGKINWVPQEGGMFVVSIRVSNVLGEDLQTYVINVGGQQGAVPSITSSPQTTVMVGQDYSYDIEVSGDPTPAINLENGPEGMSLDPEDRQLIWTPQNAGEYEVTISAINVLGSDVQEFMITVNDALSAPAISSSPVQTATVNQLYRYDVKANGNPQPTFSFQESPAGMTINETTGVIRWTPGTEGIYSITVAADNSQGSDTQTFSLDVNAQPVAPSITSTPSIETELGVTYSYDVDASGNPAPVFSLLLAPDGMQIDEESGEISWDPEQTGEYEIAIDAQNDLGTATQEFTLVVNEQQFAPIITSTPQTQTFINQAYSYTLTSEANPTATYSLISAPASMSINSVTGEISWTPPQVGTFEVSVQAANEVGDVTQDFSITVAMGLASPTILSSPITQALVSIDYEYDVDAVGNPVPSFELAEGPSGMSIDSDTGVITWLPSAPGSYPVTVEAKNSEGSFTQSFSVLVGILGSVPLVQLQSVQLVAPDALNLKAFSNPNGSPTRVTFEYGINRVDEFQVRASPEVIEGFADVEVAASLSGLQEGTTYSYRAIAENGVGRIVSATQTFTTYQSAYNIGIERQFSGAVDSLNYRLFSIPGLIDLDAGETLKGVQGQDWGVFRDDGSTVNFFKSYDGSERFHFKPGRGFWVLAKSNWTVPDQTINTVELDPNGIFQVQLQQGWNIISSPYMVPVPWALVRGVTPSVPPTAKLWGFNGSFRESNVMEPYQAYYYFNDGEVDASLLIPFPGLSTSLGELSASKVPASKQATPVSEGPRLTLEATGFDSLSASIEILLDTNSENHKDRLDQYAPRGGFSKLGLMIDPDFEAPYGFLALDARPSMDEGVVYDLVLQSEAGERVQLSLSGQNDFPGKEIHLVETETGAFIDLIDSPSVAVYPTSKRAAYHLVVGSSAFLDEQRKVLVPQSLALQQNYPNPFARTTTISFSLPEAGYVDLAVYDVLGREVQRLAGGIQPAGFYTVEWDGSSSNGSSLPNGVYLLRLTTEQGSSQVVSMTKVR